MNVSPTFLQRGETKDRDLRTPTRVAQLAAILGVDANGLRAKAGVDPIEFTGNWFFDIAVIGGALVDAPADNKKLRRFYRAVGGILMSLWGSCSYAIRDDGSLDEKVFAKIEEQFKTLIAVIERKHYGVAPFVHGASPKEGQSALYEVADTALQKLYELHADEIESHLTH